MSNKIIKIDIEENEIAGKAVTNSSRLFIVACLDCMTLQWQEYLMTYKSRNEALASVNDYKKDSYRIYEITLPRIER